MAKSYEVPNNYRRFRKEYYPAYLKEFEHFFYANLDNTIQDADFNDWVMDIYDRYGNQIQAGVGTLVQDVISGSEYRFYANFQIDSSVPNGIYYFVIYNSVTEELKYISNCFQVISNDEVDKYVFLSFKNSGNIYNFNYENVDSFNTVFIDAAVVEQQPDAEIKQYQSQSTGKVRNLKSQVRKQVNLETHFFDDEANDAMLMLSVHDNIALNNGAFEVKTPFQIETRKENARQKGIIELYDQDYSTVNLQG